MAILVVLSSGCHKGPQSNRIVFVAAPPPAISTASPEATGVLTLAEPPIQEPEDALQPPPPTPAESPRPRPRVRLAQPEPSTEPEPEPVPSVEVPVLEPAGGPGEERERRQIVQLQDLVRGRIARQENTKLSADDRRMLDDARTFLSQSQRALGTNDFQRAMTLARKASILLSVLEQQ